MKFIRLIFIFLYDLALLGYYCILIIAAFWHPKAKAWLRGRKNWRQQIKTTFKGSPHSTIWIHCASLGEFEKGRPLIELIKQKNPQQKTLLTFFSPSGYTIRKNYPNVDYCFYLPLDTKRNASDFINIVQPQLAIFIQYEFWYHYLHQLKAHQIPTYLVGATFRPNQLLFKKYGTPYLEILHCFTHLFVQDENSKKLLLEQEINNVTIAGDPRIDRVFDIAATAQSFPIVERFKNGAPLLIIGSSHPKDVEVLLPFIKKNTHWQVLIAPHEVDATSIQQLTLQLNEPVGLYTNLKASDHWKGGQILIINTIGMLNQLYQYADCVYIGGGWDRGIHNTLEPAVFGQPILIGPKYSKFVEAIAMVQIGGMKVIHTPEAFQNTMTALEQSPLREEMGTYNKQFLLDNCGGTKTIYRAIFNEVVS